MNLGKLEGLQQNIGPRSTMGSIIGLLASLLIGGAITLFVIRGGGPGNFEGAAWPLDVFVVLVIAVPVIVILCMIAQQVQAALIRYTEFVETLGRDGYPELVVEQGSKRLRELGYAINSAHQRLQQKQIEAQSNSTSNGRFYGLAESSPNIVLLMDADGEVQYLNARGRQVADAIGLGGEDVSVILPLTPTTLVEKCIANKEILREQKVSYRDRNFFWTLLPLQGEQMLQAHGTVVSRRRKADYEKRVPDSGEARSRLYSIEKHPDYQRYRGSILLVDSDDLMQGLMARYFQKEGFRVISANNGEKGLELAEQHKPDLITLDIMMPGKNGWMVLTALKDNPQLASIPVVVVSSVGNHRFVHAMGADDYVSKPIDWDALGKTVNRLSSDHRKSGALR